MFLILPLFFGMDGILFSGPIADGIAAVVAVIMVRMEMQDMRRRELASPEAN